MVSFTCLLAHLLSSVDNILFVKSSYSGAYFFAASDGSRLFIAAGFVACGDKARSNRTPCEPPKVVRSPEELRLRFECECRWYVQSDTGRHGR